jgi:hypothetical protein
VNILDKQQRLAKMMQDHFFEHSCGVTQLLLANSFVHGVYLKRMRNRRRMVKPRELDKRAGSSEGVIIRLAFDDIRILATMSVALIPLHLPDRSVFISGNKSIFTTIRSYRSLHFDSLSTLPTQIPSSNRSQHFQLRVLPFNQSGMIASAIRDKRASLLDELKRYRCLAIEFADSCEGQISARQFWSTSAADLRLLSSLSKRFLLTLGTSVPSDTTFSMSSYIGRKERYRMTPENLAGTMFLKDKLVTC